MAEYNTAGIYYFWGEIIRTYKRTQSDLIIAKGREVEIEF